MKTVIHKHSGNAASDHVARELKSDSDVVKRTLTDGIATGVFVTSVSLEASVQKTVDHKLGRTPRGVLCCMVKQGVWTPSAQVVTDKKLTLASSTACVVDLWVFG